MRNLKRVLLGVFILLLLIVVLTFALENQQSTSLMFLGWSSAQMPVAAYILLALLIGMVAGPLLAWIFGRKAGWRI
ncbi:hypothetical protein D3C85_1616040 [compost metagenome]|uniref:LapA family protein n=1 Tax=Pseudomonas sp. ACN8 TaxID=1920428 RepID=UPI000BB2F683|nr:LapA family protein [Pseudomonas sp. ACN8]PBJ23105.1 hypothetical protein BSF44_27170 [Pseudomonas sp. ACN8]